MTSSGSVSTLRAASVTPVRIRFRRQVYSGKNNINRAKGEKKPKSMFHGAICLWRDSFFPLVGKRISISVSLFPTILLLFFFSFHLLFFEIRGFEKLFLFFLPVIIFYRFRLEKFGKNRNEESFVVKRRMKNLLSLLKSNKRSQATRQSFYPSPPSRYKILTNVPFRIGSNHQQHGICLPYPNIYPAWKIHFWVWWIDQRFTNLATLFWKWNSLLLNSHGWMEKKKKKKEKLDTLSRQIVQFLPKTRIPSFHTCRIISIVSRSGQEEDGGWHALKDGKLEEGEDGITKDASNWEKGGRRRRNGG